MNQDDLYCEVLRGRHLSQETLNTEFGTKASSMLSFGAALVGAGAIILNISKRNEAASLWAFNETALLFWAFIALLVTFALVVISSLLTLYLRDWSYGPKTCDLTNMLDSSENHEDHKIARVTGDIFGKAIEYNQKVLQRKGSALRFATACLALESGTLAALAILSYWPKSS